MSLCALPMGNMAQFLNPVGTCGHYPASIAPQQNRSLRSWPGPPPVTFWVGGVERQFLSASSRPPSASMHCQWGTWPNFILLWGPVASTRHWSHLHGIEAESLGKVPQQSRFESGGWKLDSEQPRVHPSQTLCIANGEPWSHFSLPRGPAAETWHWSHPNGIEFWSLGKVPHQLRFESEGCNIDSEQPQVDPHQPLCIANRETWPQLLPLLGTCGQDPASITPQQNWSPGSWQGPPPVTLWVQGVEHQFRSASSRALSTSMHCQWGTWPNFTLLWGPVATTQHRLHLDGIKA